MKIRFFGSNSCYDCLKALVLLQKFCADIEYVDAFADETQKSCDEEGVDQLPHLQVVENGKVVAEHIGPIEDEDSFILSFSKFFSDC
jgi:glutaredoxin